MIGKTCWVKTLFFNENATDADNQLIHFDGSAYLPVHCIADVDAENDTGIKAGDIFGAFVKIDNYQFDAIRKKCEKGVYKNNTQWGTGRDPEWNEELGVYVIEHFYSSPG